MLQLCSLEYLEVCQMSVRTCTQVHIILAALLKCNTNWRKKIHEYLIPKQKDQLYFALFRTQIFAHFVQHKKEVLKKFKQATWHSKDSS